MYSKTQLLNQLVLIHLDIHLWSGRKGLKPEDLVITNELPEKVVSLGSKKIIDPEELSVFGAVKRRMERACLAMGTRFLGGYAVPKAQFDDLQQLLDAEVETAMKEKEALLSRYDAVIDAWIRKHPSFAENIRHSVVPRSVVERRIQFDWVAIHVAAVAGEQNAKRMEDRANGISAQLFYEVGAEARQTYDKSYKGRAEITQKAIAPVQRIRGKLNSLSFVDHRVQPVIDEIDSVLESLPKAGKLVGNDFLALRGLIELIADENRLKQHGDAAMNAPCEAQSPLSSDDAQEAADQELLEMPLPEPDPQPEPELEPQPVAKKVAEPATDGWFW